MTSVLAVHSFHAIGLTDKNSNRQIKISIGIQSFVTEWLVYNYLRIINICHSSPELPFRSKAQGNSSKGNAGEAQWADQCKFNVTESDLKQMVSILLIVQV